MDLSIIIVSWNVKDKLRENLKMLFQNNGDIEFEVFVVDNNSGDGSVEMVKKEFPQVKLIANEKNLGFARANNQAIKFASGRYVLLLNPDMRVFGDTLPSMVGWMDNHAEAMVAGCKLVTDKGGVIRHVRRFPNVWNQLAVILKIPHFLPFVLNRYLRRNFNYNEQAEVDSIRGGFFMIRQEAIKKIGLLDERFFVWFEEVDYCRRVKEAGGGVWYTPVAECLDYVGQSFKQLSRGKAQRYFRNSQLAYFKKYHPAWQYKLLEYAWPIGAFLTWLGGIFKIKSRART